MSGLASWWQDVLDDLETDTSTVTITMSRSMIERTRRFLALTETLEQLREAIEDEGPQPRYHREIVERHRREWPTLWAAIDELLKESE